MITVKILVDSINPDGIRIVSWLLTYPRFIHSEFMTHRVFSRNAASSRAIPIEKMLEAVKVNPACPEYWGSNQKGMQASFELEGVNRINALKHWGEGCYQASILSRMLANTGLHKQIANRVIEPWSHITVLATSTQHDNFFKLRAHPDAQPEFQVLAYRMLNEYLQHQPQPLDWENWHIPFGEQMLQYHTLEQRLKIATARAARLSYLTHDSKLIDYQKDYELHDKLIASGHWSPFEHCACAITDKRTNSNFRGWMQYRKLFEQENCEKADLKMIMNTKPEWITI